MYVHNVDRGEGHTFTWQDIEVKHALVDPSTAQYICKYTVQYTFSWVTYLLQTTIHLRVRRMEMSIWRPAGRPGEDEDDDAD